MAHTTEANIELMMGETYSTTTTPTSTQITTIITWSDAKVDADANRFTMSTTDKQYLSTLWACHTIVVNQPEMYRDGDMQIEHPRLARSKQVSSRFEHQYNAFLVSLKRDTGHSKVNAY